jgi:hypothetical protein
MKDTTKVRHVSDVSLENEAVTVKQPFKLSQEDQRRYVRIEISSPMSMRKVKDAFGNFWPEGDTYSIDGTILNMSAGGVLVEINEPLADGEVVLLRFTTQGEKAVDNILGLTKRCEACDESAYLAGVQFIDRQQLLDVMSEAEIDSLSGECDDFQDRVMHMLQQHIVREHRV